MGFLALSIDKNCLIQQKADLEYQEMVYTHKYNDITSELSDMESTTTTSTSSATGALAALQEQQELYDSKKSTIESQLEVINAEVESYQKAASSEIKTSCKLNISG